MSAITALCVMTAVVVPSSRLIRCDRFQHQDAGVHVEGAGRLVAQQHGRLLGHRAGDRHALLLAAGQLRGKVVLPLAQVDQSPARRPGSSGRVAMSVTSATFSRAVRLGIRL